MPTPSSGMSMRRTTEDLLVGLFGFGTSLLTAVGLWWLETNAGFALYTWMLLLVVPLGALSSGVVAASGYYAGARLFNHRPTRVLLVSVLMASLGAFLTIHYLSYSTLKVDGEPLSELISFAGFLDLSIRSTSMGSVGRSADATTGELGGWGYGVTALQVIGFAIGGLAVYRHLTLIPYCERCSRYFAHKARQIRLTKDANGLQASAVQLQSDFAAGAVASAVRRHAAIGEPGLPRGSRIRSLIDLRHCKRCGQHWVRCRVEVFGGRDWEDVPVLAAACFTDEVVELNDTAADAAPAHGG